MNDHMNEMLTTKDPKLNELVYSLIDQELKLNLIEAKDLPTRFKEVKEFMIRVLPVGKLEDNAKFQVS